MGGGPRISRESSLLLHTTASLLTQLSNTPSPETSALNSQAQVRSSETRFTISA